MSPILQWKETPAQFFICEIGETFKKVFLENICKRQLLTDDQWGPTSGMAYPVLYNKNIFQVFVSLVYRQYLFLVW